MRSLSWLFSNNTRAALWYICFSLDPTVSIGPSSFQQVFKLQLPVTPWHLHSLFVLDRTTFLPTSLLCKLKATLASFPFSRLSIKRLVTFSPNLMLSLHPPHCQSSPGLCDFLMTAQLHPGIFPCLHCVVILCVMAAVLIACTNAVSRLAYGSVVFTKIGSCLWICLWLREQFHISFLNCLRHSSSPRWPPSLMMFDNNW